MQPCVASEPGVVRAGVAAVLAHGDKIFGNFWNFQNSRSNFENSNLKIENSILKIENSILNFQNLSAYKLKLPRL